MEEPTISKYPSVLLYGGPGTGKTYLACSSFYDYETGESFGNGKLITFGSEDNPALDIPEEHRRIGTRTSLRLTSPKLDSQDFLDTFRKVQLALYEENRKGTPVDAIVIDGLSELDLMIQATTKLDGFAKWEGLINEMFAIVSLMRPEHMGCPVFVTARVVEKKKDIFDKGGTLLSSGDPDYMNYDYYPSLRGKFKEHLPHAFSMVLYLETVQHLMRDGPYKGEHIPKHVVNMGRIGSFYVKNQWEHKWMRRELPLRLINTTWPRIWSRIEGVNMPLSQIVPLSEEGKNEIQNEKSEE